LVEVSENEPTVLCVNDDPDQFNLLETQLRLAQYRVLSAFDGLEAFDVAKRERPDLIISDVAMPRTDGIELCRAIRADADLSTTPILLVSAMRKDTESAVEGLRAGADEYLEAPYSPMRLVALASRLVERKRGEDKLRRQALVFKTIRDGVVIVGLDGHITDVNPAAERIFGYIREEAVGLKPEVFHPPSCKKQFEEEIPAALLGKARWTGEMAFVNKDGVEGVAEVVVLVLRDAQNKPVSIVVIYRDITERGQAEQALRDSEERYRIVAETASDAIVSIDASSTILFVNSAAEKIFGHAIVEMTGRNLTMLMPEYLRHLHEAGLNRYAETGHKHISWDSIELPGLHKDGREIPLEISFGEYVREGQRIFTGVIRDITERKRTEAERQIISEIIQGVSSTHNVDELLRLIQRAINRVLHAENCFVALYNKESESLEMEFFVDKYDETPPPQKLGKSRTSYVFRTGQPLLMNEEIFRQLAESGEVEQRGTVPASWLGVPLRSPSEVIGVLVVQSYEDENAYSARDLEFLSSVGGQVALAIERKRGEAALHETNETLLTLINGSPLAIVALDTENCVTAWNPAAERIFGWSEREMLGHPVPFLSDEMRDNTLQLIERVYRGESLTGYEMTRHRRDGTPIEVSISFSLLRDAESTARGVVAVLEDITERKRMDEALKEANQRALLEYERLLERIAALAQSLGTSRDLLTVYRAFKDFALASTPCNGMFISHYHASRSVRTAEYAWSDGMEFDHANLPPMSMNDSPHSRAVATGQIIISDDYQADIARTPVVNIGDLSESCLPQSALIVPMAVMGRVIGAIELQSLEPAAFRQEHATAMRMAANLTAVAIDNVRLINQEHEKEGQLRQSQKMQAVGQLAGGVAHDFNNLLVAINGYSDLTLRRLQANDPLRRNLEEIKKAGERAAALTRQLLAFSRKQVMQPKVISLNDVVSDMNKLLRRLIGEDIELTTVLDANIGHVKADPNMLEQVILNLAVNSRDAMPDGGRLTVETSNVRLADDYMNHHAGISPGAYVLLTVSDTGTGMDPGTQERLFEPFFTTKAIGKGTGLGLSTVYGIVKQSGGNVLVYSEVGHGTSFKIYLPRVDEQAKEVVQDSDSALPVGTEKILLVEDDALVRNVVREIISMQGYAVLVAETMAEAVRHCAENPDIALLLSDVVMPQINGKELSQRLTKLLPGMLVLFMSGYSETVVHNGVLDEGVNFIQKPFTPNALLRKLREVLDGAGDVQSAREELLLERDSH
jgi:PAS domain S-box-containing protein